MKTTTLSFRLPPNEKTKLIEKAQSMGLSLADYISTLVNKNDGDFLNDNSPQQPLEPSPSVMPPSQFEPTLYSNETQEIEMDENEEDFELEEDDEDLEDGVTIYFGKLESTFFNLMEHFKTQQEDASLPEIIVATLLQSKNNEENFIQRDFNHFFNQTQKLQ